MNFPLGILGSKEFREASDSVQQFIFSGINDPFLTLVDPEGINRIVVRLLKIAGVPSSSSCSCSEHRLSCEMLLRTLFQMEGKGRVRGVWPLTDL